MTAVLPWRASGWKPFNEMLLLIICSRRQPWCCYVPGIYQICFHIHPVSAFFTAYFISLSFSSPPWPSPSSAAAAVDVEKANYQIYRTRYYIKTREFSADRQSTIDVSWVSEPVAPWGFQWWWWAIRRDSCRKWYRPYLVLLSYHSCRPLRESEFVYMRTTNFRIVVLRRWLFSGNC